MPTTTFPAIAALLREKDDFLVLSHLRPDGDAIGSQIALALSLLEMGKRVTVWNEDGLPARFDFLPGSHLVQAPSGPVRPFSAVLALDCATQPRLGAPLNFIAPQPPPVWVVMDHHISNPGYGDINCILGSAPATGEILYEFLTSQSLPLTADIGQSLFAAISTDTGSFQYPQTTARTYEIGAELIRLGVRPGEISQKLYESHPLRRIRLLQALLNRMKLTADDRVASFSLPLAIVQELGTIPDDTEGMIDHIRCIDSVAVAAFFEELPENKVRVSLRSKRPEHDVAAIATSLGGGGHRLAAGIRCRGTLAEVEAEVLSLLTALVHHS